MRRIVLHMLVCFFVLANTNTFAQSYPVQAFVQLSPPYTGYLPDYADPFNEQLKIILTLNDFSVSSYSVKIRLKITGSGFTMQTKPYLAFPAIDLTPGLPVQISGSELAPYLSSANLDFTGIGVSEYELHKVLPEGMYTICVEVLDYFNASAPVLSNEGCAQAWFTLHEPPLLNTPFCGSEITPMNPQTVLFNWSPLHMTSPKAAFNTEYKFQLYEVRPPGTNANIITATTLPVFEQTTINTFLNYGITEPLLQTGMQYVWRVQAYTIDGRDAFRNNGYSQVCLFTYGNIAEVVSGGITLNLSAASIGPRVGAANWNASAAFTHYTLEVRKAGNPAYAWFPYNFTAGTGKLTGLEPQTQYECRVKGHNGTYESEYSNVAMFTTLPLPDYSCNNTMMPPAQVGAPLLQNLPVGAIVSAGQFDMRVTNVIAKNGPGTFTGFGKIHIPFAMLNLSVYFDRVQIDENMTMKGGRIIALTEGIDQWAAGALDNTYNWGEPDYYVNGNVDSVHLDGNTIVIFTDAGPITINYPGGNYVIEDEDGDQWIVHADGTITYQPVVPHVELTADEKLVYKKAMRLIKQENTPSVVSSKKAAYENDKVSLGSKLESAVGKNYLNADTTKQEGILFLVEESEGNASSGTSEVNTFRNSRRAYYVSKQLNAMGKNNLSQGEYDFLANRVLMNGEPSYLYIRENLASMPFEQLVGEVKEAIEMMVELEVN